MEFEDLSRWERWGKDLASLPSLIFPAMLMASIEGLGGLGFSVGAFVGLILSNYAFMRYFLREVFPITAFTMALFFLAQVGFWLAVTLLIPYSLL